ncbi:hypothetical protein GGTG_12072 [Gaeumannomyces tritici R3-111a-1]|uniref:Heterokaryon incompatibility domain-containing protein n=1 Tax=Gaeumannomyces tritici (strain R3-111a-1) TaxID=644352 RepID=J3PEZ3_GAET3|nr:hypothetical protein GGTG_12072 [Gaeumannomyces tritici R3-111a-1]EJT71051.1 hypothetical protein GGTG_12072 [Gaeumannomyces tritici R3-111a-1]
MSRMLAFSLIPISDTMPDSLYNQVEQNQIDLSACRKWIASCGREHANDCGVVSGPVRLGLETTLRLIDAVDECVVVAPPDARYVTLSYVWGQVQSLKLGSSNAPVLAQKGSLFSQETRVAQTIVDAATVVRALGERYLWADQLCIIQDAPDKALQIKAMDKIYGGALLTIVAADGDNADTGLPGVRPGTRGRNITQIREEIWPGLGAAVAIDPPLDPAGSIWGSRGWAFQEQLLSKRLLLFYQGGVFWQCRTAVFYEDAPAAAKVGTGQMPRLEQLSPRWAAGQAPAPIVEIQEDHLPEPLLRPAVFTEYANAVKEYTKRNLTYSDDIINAFEGISSQLSHHIGNSFLAALPESYLDVALLWTPVVRQIRRDCRRTRFPSWSWTGWIGRAEYDTTSPDGREWIEPNIKWYLKDGTTAPRLANQVGIGIDEVPLGCKLSSNSLSWMPTFDSVASQAGEVPTLEFPDMRGPYLQLWTSCSFFTIDRRSWRTPEEFQVNSSARSPIQANILCATGNSRQLAGHMILNGDGPEEVTRERHGFIVLSGAYVKGFDPISGKLTYSDESQMYNVMLVEWDPARQIASRLGIGRIFKEAWDTSLPVIRYVTIG